MANILITGDSWACVPWQAYYHYFTMNELDDESNLKKLKEMWLLPAKGNEQLDGIFEWLDFQFIKCGHHVNNIGYWSVGNMRQIIRAKGYLDAAHIQNQPIDLIVWFHTEIPRDWSGDDWIVAKKFGYDEFLKVSARGLYNYVSAMKEMHPKTKWAIIGGHAPLVESEKHLLDWAEFRIDNWRQEITGVECPETHLTGHLHWEDKNINSLLTLEQKERELVLIEKIVEVCKDTKLFYDGVHPSIGPNKALAEKIIKHFRLNIHGKHQSL